MSDFISNIGSKVKQGFNNAVTWTKQATADAIDYSTDDSQTKLGRKQQNKDGKPAGKKTDGKVIVRNNPYSTAYGIKAAPAAMSVDPIFSKSEGDIGPNWPYEKNGDDESGMLPFSLFNRYALYNFRGFYGGYAPSLADFYKDSNPESGAKFRGGELRGYDLIDVNEKKIIDFYAEHFPRIAYSPTDFMYNKYFQQIPVNHLITLRRFAMPCEDNVFEAMVLGTNAKGEEVINENNYLATCTATTYFGEKAENKLEDILKFTAGLGWKEQEAQLQEISAGSSTKGPGAFDKGYKGKDNKFMNGLGATMAGRSAADLYRAEHFGGGSDPMHKYSSFVLGPVNVIDKTQIRNRGLQFKNEIELTFDYELKSWYMVNPKIAMLDLFSNMLVMTTNNGNFWGGGWRYTGGQSQSLITDLYGDSSLLRKGDFIGYAQSVVTDVIHGNDKGVKGITGLFGDGSGSFSFKSILGGVKDLLQNLLTQKIGSLMDEFSGGQQNAGSNTPKALLSAEPTGYWHVTIGNPLNPIAIMGNMICKDNEFVLGGGLGYDDFPMEFKVKVKLDHGKPRDRSDIENMFNMGHGRIYAAPADDVLNIAGKEIQEYGVMPTGPGMHTGIKEIAPKVKLNQEHVANIIAMDILS